MVSAKSTPKIQESQVPSFLDFKKNNLSAKTVDYTTSENEESDKNEEEYDHFYSYNEFISALETIDTTKKAIEKPKVVENEEEKAPELKEVNLLVGRFQPFHNQHLEVLSALSHEFDQM